MPHINNAAWVHASSLVDSAISRYITYAGHSPGDSPRVYSRYVSIPDLYRCAVSHGMINHAPQPVWGETLTRFFEKTIAHSPTDMEALAEIFTYANAVFHLDRPQAAYWHFCCTLAEVLTAHHPRLSVVITHLLRTETNG